MKDDLEHLIIQFIKYQSKNHLFITNLGSILNKHTVNYQDILKYPATILNELGTF